MSDHHDLADANAALRADNARLRRLLDEAGVPDGLRHGLRDTLAMLRAIVRRSADTAEDVEGYAAHLEGRLDAIGRARVAADAFGEVDLHALVADELMAHVVREGERASLAGPCVKLRPKAGQVLALAVHELVTNAIEHGTLGEGRGRVDVSWRVETGGAEPVVALVWKEAGGAGLAAPVRRGFGTAVLEGMLAHELDACAALAYEPDGLRCTVRIPIPARVGRLVTSSGEQDDDAGD
jgi:two-component sensor histidine kinase